MPIAGWARYRIPVHAAANAIGSCGKRKLEPKQAGDVGAVIDTDIPLLGEKKTPSEPHAPPPDVRRLAAALRMPLSLPDLDDGSVRIDPPLVEFAARRHRVDCLLYPWLQRSLPGALSPETVRSLKKARRRSVVRALSLDTLSLKIRDLCAGDVPSLLFFKGPSLARDLYADHMLSRSRDVDVLVDRRDFKRVAERLLAAGLEPSKPSRRANPRTMDWFYYRWMKDIELIDAARIVHVELHHRRFLVDRLPPFSAAPAKDKSDVPHALLDAAYATYLIAHGTQTGWHRLKWLADLTQVWRHLTERQILETIALCEAAEIAVASRASVAFAEDVFPRSTPAALLDWAIGSARKADVDALRLRYGRALLDPVVSPWPGLWRTYGSTPYDRRGPRLETLGRAVIASALHRLRRIV